jgi:hypothetical protein
MAPERRRRLLLAALLLVIVSVAVYQWRGAPAGGGSARQPSGVSSGDTTGRAGADAGMPGIPEVNLDRLNEDRPEPVSGNRNPFRFGAPPPAASAAAMGEPRISDLPPMPAAPPPPPPIPLRFIGVVEARGQAKKLAVLSDPQAVHYGREGDIIDGRYRIVRIGAESIEMMHLDGRGRQTIRLSGS